jgi:hypothetical protein
LLISPRFPVLQYRWQLRGLDDDPSLVYYGLRNPPRHTLSVVKIEKEVARGIRGLCGTVSLTELPESLVNHPRFKQLVDDGVIVDRNEVREPATPGNRQRCVCCVNDDYILPGLEFDERGMCAFCQCYEHAQRAGVSAGPQNFITEDELLQSARENKRSRFDVMVLCTGGKDSTYLLWLLAKKLGLRVLAASWNMPYTAECSRENLRRSLRLLPSVELVEHTLPWDMIRRAMRGQFSSVGVPCLCPTVAHVLFFPLAVAERIPFIMQGVEEVQLAAASYVMAEIRSEGGDKAAAGSAAHRQASADMRAQTLGFFNMVAHAPKPPSPYAFGSELLRYQRSVREQLTPLYGRLDAVLERAANDPALSIPELRRLKTNEKYGTWKEATELMKREMDWRMPPGHKGMLHTSCSIEKVKDYCQFMRFRNMRSPFFPQSIVEVGAGVFFGLLTREEALAELEELGYLGEPEAMEPLLKDLGVERGNIDAEGELAYSLCDCLVRH